MPLRYRAMESGVQRRGEHRHRNGRLAATVLATAIVLSLLHALPAAAFTPDTQLAIAAEAARLAPPDLARQIERRDERYRAGVLAPFRDGDPSRHRAGADGRLAQVVEEEAQEAVRLIRTHRPFDEVVFQLGVVAHHVADANFPLNAADADPEERRYFVDFARYVESAEPRLPLVFYGVVPGLEEQPDVSALVASTLDRSRRLYPQVGREYRRIGFASGVGRFDDRSSAFGVASLSFNHSVTDIVRVLRWIWIRAGGADGRDALPHRGERVLLLPRRPPSADR